MEFLRYKRLCHFVTLFTLPDKLMICVYGACSDATKTAFESDFILTKLSKGVIPI